MSSHMSLLRVLPTSEGVQSVSLICPIGPGVSVAVLASTIQKASGLANFFGATCIGGDGTTYNIRVSPVDAPTYADWYTAGAISDRTDTGSIASIEPAWLSIAKWLRIESVGSNVADKTITLWSV